MTAYWLLRMAPGHVEKAEAQPPHSVVFLVGVEKAGTTELFDRLVHAGVVLPPMLKELRVFDVPCSAEVNGSKFAAEQSAARATWWRANFGWRAPPTKSAYLALFPVPRTPVSVRHRLGEATPSYVFDECALDRILAWFPDARFVLTLRKYVCCVLCAV
jgi:hypothetical protein